MTTDDLNDDAQDPGRLRKMYEDAAAQAAAAEARASAAETREMFRDAGLDLANRQHQAFVRAYDGDRNPDAVKNYVAELGITESQQAPPPPPPVDETDQAALIRMAEAARDGGGAPPPQSDARQELERKMEEAYRRKASIQEIDALSIEYARLGGGRVVGE